jgi:hypothetical protein
MRCKNCKEKFEPVRFNHKYCLKDECVRAFVAEAREKQWKQTKTRMKENLKTTSDWLKEAQVVFNKYIRERDKNKPCISCGSKINGVKHASHYLSAGGHSNVRFHEDNVWVSCYKCNVMLSGNQIEYRKRLIQKIGVERVEWLENNGNIVKKWTKEELKLLITEYKKKTKQLEK